MKTVLRIFVGSLFTSLFILLVLFATIRLEILNKSFLFATFENHNIYTQLPSLLASSLLPNDHNLSEFAKNISPQVVKPLVEDNLSQIIDFLNGSSKNILISISLQGIGFENTTGIHWSLSDIPDKNLQKRIQAVNGIGSTLIVACIIIFISLIVLFFIYGRLTKPKQLFGGKALFLSSGIYIVITSLGIKLFLMTITKDLLNGKETSQQMLGLLSNSLFADTTTTWLIIGTVLILFWSIVKLSIYVRSASSQLKLS